jgi:hypothetical protein
VLFRSTAGPAYPSRLHSHSSHPTAMPPTAPMVMAPILASTLTATPWTDSTLSWSRGYATEDHFTGCGCATTRVFNTSGLSAGPFTCGGHQTRTHRP